MMVLMLYFVRKSMEAFVKNSPEPALTESEDQRRISMTNETYTTHVLDNGLTVLLQENHSSPIISHWIWYRVGSRNEVPGKTGISHFVEHMQFKGTKNFPERDPSWEISRNGGEMNAFTLLDCTGFYETMRADRIGIAIDSEADRMENSLFDPEETELERSVVLSEKLIGESDPASHLEGSIKKAAFPNHPYRHAIIGETEDLYSLTRDDLYEYYRTWYAPNNAVVSMVGHFNTDEMLRRLEASYGHIPERPVPAMDIPPEKPISAPVRIEAHGESTCRRLYLDWHIPGWRDPVIPAVILLHNIFTGPFSMNIYEEGSMLCRTSRLFQKLVTGELASDVYCNLTPALDPYIFGITARVASRVEVETVSDAIFEEIESIARKGIPPAEIEKARKQAKAAFAWADEDVTHRAHWLGYSSMFADPAWYDDCLKRIENVSPEDISRAAETLLRRDNCVTGIYFAEKE